MMIVFAIAAAVAIGAPIAAGVCKVYRIIAAV